MEILMTVIFIFGVIPLVLFLGWVIIIKVLMLFLGTKVGQKLTDGIPNNGEAYEEWKKREESIKQAEYIARAVKNPDSKVHISDRLDIR